MSDAGVYPERLYDYNSGHYCGVLVKENVMKRMAKLESKYLAEMRRLLLEEHEKGNVFASSWGLVYPNGKQETFHYIDQLEDIKHRISLATIMTKVRYIPVAFEAKNREQAQMLADKFYGVVTDD